MTRDFHRPLTPKKLSQLAESVTQASALEPGLTMVVGPYSELVHFVYATMVIDSAFVHLNFSTLP